jgi:carbon storage regulator CsrA
MTVLDCKVGDSIDIDGRIRVTVAEVYADRVRLAVDAPSDVPVTRSEAPSQVRQVVIARDDATPEPDPFMAGG